MYWVADYKCSTKAANVPGRIVRLHAHDQASETDTHIHRYSATIADSHNMMSTTGGLDGKGGIW